DGIRRFHVTGVQTCALPISGESAQAFAQNAAQGMQLRFNIWPGDITFGGNFDPAILPVHQYINWVQYSSYQGGSFQFEWREDFRSEERRVGKDSKAVWEDRW